MHLHFTKMHGLGNDFMVIDGVHQSVHLTSADIQHLSRRDIGIGFDQCLVVSQSDQPGIDFFYHIYNADGQAVGQCGNGARCLARFIQAQNLSNKKTLVVATTTTSLSLQLNEDDSVTVNMGHPDIFPEMISLSPEGEPIALHTLNIGNPHAILMVADLAHAPVQTLGKAICEDEFFPDQTNVEFATIINPGHLNLRVYERGCGETRACGSGAVAAAAIGIKFYAMDEKIVVNLPGGELIVEWPEMNGPIFLTGPAAFVYEGKL